MNKRENAGYIIINQMEVGSKEIVLGEMNTASGSKYVTWQCKNGEDYYWGHYHDNKLDALADFCKRGLEEAAFLKSLEPQKKENHER